MSKDGLYPNPKRVKPLLSKCSEKYPELIPQIKKLCGWELPPHLKKSIPKKLVLKSKISLI